MVGSKRCQVAANAAKYPLLAAEAKRYLSSSPTSVASEHVFSAAGRIYTDKRLLPKRWKKIEQKSRKKSRFRFFRFLAKKSRFSISNSGIVHHYTQTLVVSRTCSSFGDRIFAAARPQVWNSLSPNLRLCGLSCGQFRWLLKTFLFRQ